MRYHITSCRDRALCRDRRHPLRHSRTTTTHSRSGHLNVPQDKWLSPTQISEKLEQKGYTVNEIEVDDGAYEVELVDKRNGTRIEAHVHPATGELLLGYDD